MEPNNPNYQPQDPSSQPIPQPQQPQPAAGSNPPYNAQPNQPQVYGSVDPQQTSPAYGQVPVGQPPTYPQQPGQPYMPQQPYASTPGSGNKKLLFGIIGGVVALAIIGVVLFAVLSKKSNTGNNGNTANNSTSTSASSASSSSTTSKTACQLFTLTNAQSIEGSSATSNPLPSPTGGSGFTVTGCDYSGQGNIQDIHINVWVYSSASKASSDYKLTTEVKGNVPVSGVGDQALWNSNNGFAAVKGDVVINVLSSDSNGNDSQSTDTSVANTIFSNL